MFGETVIVCEYLFLHYTCVRKFLSSEDRVVCLEIVIISSCKLPERFHWTRGYLHFAPSVQSI